VGRPALLLLLGVAVLGAGCGAGEPRAVPDVRGQRLDVAERRLDDAGLEYERVGGGAFGIVVRSNWHVCSQSPAPGAEATRVRLVVDRHCPAPPRPTRHVPDVVGGTLAAARADLDRREVPYRVVGGRRGDLVVCDQRPAGGRRAADVVLYVGSACAPPPPPPAPAPPLLPLVEGLDLAEAEEHLVARGVAITVAPAWGASHHDVCRQDPPAGTPSWRVTLHVAGRC
jgi:hypothetical protein